MAVRRAQEIAAQRVGTAIIGTAIIGTAIICAAACAPVVHRNPAALLAPDRPELVFAAKASGASLPPLPSHGCHLPLAGRTQATPADGAERRISSGGRTRRFLLEVPASATTSEAGPVPLVLNLHGLTESPGIQQRFSAMGELAQARGWVLAWPEGIGYSWNAGACCGRARDEQVDDVAFLRDLVAELGRELCIDLRRVYATGMSNGGFMSYRLACDASDLFAAVAPVAAVDGTASCKPSRPVPLLAFNGSSDLVVPITGRRWDGFPSAQESVDRWSERNRCGGETRKLYSRGDVLCTAASGCAGQADVVFCSVNGGGHTWPGGMGVPYLGKTSDSIDASQAILDFFSAHARQ